MKTYVDPYLHTRPRKLVTDYMEKPSTKSRFVASYVGSHLIRNQGRWTNDFRTKYLKKLIKEKLKTKKKMDYKDLWDDQDREFHRRRELHKRWMNRYDGQMSR